MHSDPSPSPAWNQFGADYDQPPFAGVPQTYVIASTPRSGSHYLGHLLHATGALGSPLEYFQPALMQKWREALGADDFASIMARLFERRTSPSGWFGVKAHWPDFAPIAQDPERMRILNTRDYIVIRRRDRIAQAISIWIAFQTKAWISFHEKTAEPTYNFEAIHNAAAKLEQQAAQWDAYLDSQGLTPFVVDYEALVEQPDAIVDAILERLNVTRAAPPQHGWQPTRQASELNLRWQEQYASDLEARSA